MTPRVLTGRGRTGSDSVGRIAHAVAYDGECGGGCFERALCGARPGRTSNGWSDYPAKAVTCPKCLAKMEELKQDREGNW